MVNEIRTGGPRGFNKGRNSEFPVDARVRQTPEEGRSSYRLKTCVTMKTVVRKPLMIKIIKLRLRNSDS